jgi:hypothetical protein
MARSPDSGRLDLAEVFYSVQEEMLAQLAVGGFFEHPSAAGTATEQHWLELFNRYLPQRYRATPAFVIDSEGRRSRQIDIAIFDNLYSPLLFPHKSGMHIPAESVYAVFEVKPTFSRQWIRDAGEKAASVRALRRTSVRVMSGNRLRAPIHLKPILAGLLATGEIWGNDDFQYHWDVGDGHISHLLISQNKKPQSLDWGFSRFNWATSYSPTHSRVQYHRG